MGAGGGSLDSFSGGLSFVTDQFTAGALQNGTKKYCAETPMSISRVVSVLRNSFDVIQNVHT